MLFLITMFGLLTQQAAVVTREKIERLDTFDEAFAFARASGKPLLVAGGPWGGASFRRALNWQAHGHGDVCLDLKSEACGESHFVFGDVRDIPFPNGHFGAAFCSHVLEHLPTPEDCWDAVAELQRVADEVFICVPGKGGLLAWFAPEHRLWVTMEDGVVVAAESMKPDRIF